MPEDAPEPAAPETAAPLRELTAADHQWLDDVFRYHAPTGRQVPLYEELRAAGKVFAATILRCCPASADRSAALRKVREATHTANAAIALGGRA